MLSEAQNWIREHNPRAMVQVYGQDYNPRSFAVAASDLLIMGQKDGKIEFGNTLIDDEFASQQFDYLLANPPFGVEGKAEQKELERKSHFHGYTGKLPRQETIQNFVMFLPTLDENEQILAKVKEATTGIDMIRDVTTDSIRLLRERRAAP